VEAVTDSAPKTLFEGENERLLARRDELLAGLLARGETPSDAATRASEALNEHIADRAEAFAEHLLELGEGYPADRRTYQDEFNERLRSEHGWGQPLDVYVQVVAIIEGASRAFLSRNRQRHSAPDGPDELLDVLAQLNGQAIRVAREIHVLLSGGYPLGALALSRSAHEIAVRAVVLAEYGREPEHEDLARRFLLHGKIANLKDAEVFQRDAETLGYEPFEPAFIQQLTTERDDLIATYDKAYKHPYGWAAKLPGVSGVRFDELERLAHMSHRRGMYQWSSHIVHADARSLTLSNVERGGGRAVLMDATNVGLFAPAEHALYSLNLTFVHLVTCVEVAPIDVAVMKALAVLLDEMRDGLAVAEARVDDAEERLQSELAREGKRLTPWGVEAVIGSD
jgi:hypothetical protein